MRNAPFAYFYVQFAYFMSTICEYLTYDIHNLFAPYMCDPYKNQAYFAGALCLSGNIAHTACVLQSLLLA